MKRVDKPQAKRLAASLLKWYAANKRDLPWRREAHDPYRVWISEALLQQTQVKTVIPYYERFLARFPTVRALASARLDTVLKTWEGAGYYARARNLHRAAKEIVSRYRGKIPSTVDALITLPGIGRYTAGAIASIAFNQRAPVVDGNAIRVLCRVFGIRRDPGATATRATLWQIAGDLVPAQSPGDFNQALMELGALVCTPRAPACPECPLQHVCVARRLGKQEQIPIKRAKKPLPYYDIGIGIVWNKGKVLIDQRNANDLLGGLWEFPGGKKERGETLVECVRREIKEELGVTVRVGKEIAVVEHGYSHFRITMHAFECRYLSGEPRAIECARWKWMSPKQLSRYAFPAANRKIIAMLQGGGRRGRFDKPATS